MRVLRLLGLLGLLATPEVARAQVSHEGPPEAAHPTLVVTRGDAINRGALRSPDVAVASAPRTSAEAAESSATPFVRPPNLSVFAGFRARAPVQGPEVTVTLTQDLALRGLGDARRDAAKQLRTAVQSDVERARWDGALRGLVAWQLALEAKEVLRIRSEAALQAEAVASSTRSRVGSGVGQPRELALAEGDVGSAHASVLEAEGTLFEAYVELRYALGLQPDMPVDVSGDLYASDERAVDHDTAVRATGDHPTLRTARARTELANREVELARAHFGPLASVGGSYSREASGEQIFGALVGVPLPLVDPSRYEQARLRTNEDTARAVSARVEQELKRDVRIALHDREHWRDVREALRTRALGPLREAVRLARKEYEVGTQDVSMVLLARQKLLAAEEQMARAAGAVLRADATVSYLTGALVPIPRANAPRGGP